MNSFCSSDLYFVAGTVEVIVFMVAVVAVMITTKMVVKIADA
jgi:hypothetical protein